MKMGAHLIDLLAQRDIGYFFGNPGTEFTSIIEAFADRNASGKTNPIPILVPHEGVAVNMAYGAYLATGSAQAVMVHATVGAANAATAIINASRMNIPMLFIAGRTPITESGDELASRDKFIHWAQESFDQGGMIREYVKWDYELRDADQLDAVLDRAMSIMMSAPRGPVYLQLPRELLLRDVVPKPDLPHSGSRASQLGVPDPYQMTKLVDLIANARQPMLLTKTLGEDHAAVAHLEAFASQFAVPVITPDAHYYNISSSHPMFFGYDANQLIKNADLVINLGMDVPWCPVSNGPQETATVIHIGEDPLFQKIPIRTHRGDVYLTANIGQTLAQLIALMTGKVDKKRIEERRTAFVRPKVSPGTPSKARLTHALVSHGLNEIWDDQCVLVNELSLPPDFIVFNRPGSYFRTGSASGLGWGLGAAVGLSLALPDKTIIAVVGDGSYYFANPMVIHWLAQKHQLKLLTVILNNSGMQSFQSLTRKHFPVGAANSQNEFPLTSLSPTPSFENMAPIFDGVGYVVTSPSQLGGVLETAKEGVRKSGKQGIVNIKLE